MLNNNSMQHAPIDILAFGAHPDDVEIGVAATLAKESRSGARVVICDLTAGEMGTNGDAPTRAREAQAAASILGAIARYCLGLPDAGLQQVMAEGASMAAGLIRALRPRMVLAPWGEDRHPDHRDAHEIVRRAVFLAGLAKHEPLMLPDGVPDGRDAVPYRPQLLFFYLINSPVRPQLLVDVSEHYQYKRQALAAFDSQFASRGRRSPTPLNDGIFLPGVEGRDASFGRHAGVAYAEGFVGERFPCLESLLTVKTCS